MSDKLKSMDIKEFRELGFLQEVNRMFFHPMGLALMTMIDEETGEESLAGIWDCRDDEEGIYFDIANAPEEDKERFKKGLEYVEKHADKIASSRLNKLGFIIEPIEE